MVKSWWIATENITMLLQSLVELWQKYTNKIIFYTHASIVTNLKVYKLNVTLEVNTNSFYHI